MEHVKLGNTGLDVSKICLGCMSFGEKQPDFHQWVLNEEEARGIIKEALERGINFFDTANCYAGGTSEEILGRAIRDFANREEVAIATKTAIFYSSPPLGKKERGCHAYKHDSPFLFR